MLHHTARVHLEIGERNQILGKFDRHEQPLKDHLTAAKITAIQGAINGSYKSAIDRVNNKLKIRNK